ncbi:hypothetical protein [Methylobacterium planeticum]|uniref:Uncharacterized protein n=1 Tax=Methylobacterium planeticum TaxID=2615211 RepID=A0A6N6MIJ0_9HYPH|nr:hypothetical protein [Methylobacterium planeticum]KAB1069323.1 hypothetical protein F6X51_25425 [Methylobacterium planeticum]
MRTALFALVLFAVALFIAASNAEADATQRHRRSTDPFSPIAAQAVRLVREHTTNGYISVGQTLAYAQKVRPESFRVDRLWAEQREDEPFTRVHICYWLRNPGVRAQPACGIDYIVTVNPPHVRLARPLDGVSRDLQAGREQFVRSIDRELALQREPATKALRDTLAPFNPYDWR